MNHVVAESWHRHEHSFCACSNTRGPTLGHPALQERPLQFDDSVPFNGADFERRWTSNVVGFDSDVTILGLPCSALFGPRHKLPGLVTWSSQRLGIGITHH